MARSDDADMRQISLLCRSCGGQRHFDPPSGTLKCLSCGDMEAITSSNETDPRAELLYDEDAPDEPTRGGADAYRCHTCGGEVVFAATALSERCAYCDGPLVKQPATDEFATLAIIPFQQNDEAAKQGGKSWVSGRLAAPNDLEDAVRDGRLAAIYVPFFTFDSAVFVKYRGYYKVGKNSRRRLEGAFETFFDDLLVPASPHVTALIRDGVIHDFEPDFLRSFNPAFLAGFSAEKHHVTVAEGLKLKRDDKQVIIRNRIMKHAKRNLQGLRFSTDTSGIKYRRILLPVYITHYRYGGNAYKIATCGLHGKTFGERPFSAKKLFGYAALAATLAVAAGVPYGLMGLP